MISEFESPTTSHCTSFTRARSKSQNVRVPEYVIRNPLFEFEEGDHCTPSSHAPAGSRRSSPGAPAVGDPYQYSRNMLSRALVDETPQLSSQRQNRAVT